MKILIYFRELRFGGVHTYLISQVDYLVRQGHQVWVSYANEKTRSMFATLGTRGLENKELVRSALRIDKDLCALWKAYLFCRRQRIDCVFSHTSKGGAIGRVAGFLAGSTKRIHVIHGFSFHEFTKWYQEYFGRNIERLLAVLSTQIISVNEDDRVTAIKKRICKPEKITTVLNGVRIPSNDEFLPDNEIDVFLNSEGLDAETKVILFVGRLMRQKAPLDLIKAFHYMNHAKAHLVMIGEGPLLNKCQQLINELRLNGKISMLGFREDVAKWYQASSIFVLPSLWEGLPMTLLEAMSYGACCLATDIKGNRECITDGEDGILVMPDCPAKLATEIETLLKSRRKRQQYGQYARKKVEQQFSQRKMCQKTHQIICS